MRALTISAPALRRGSSWIPFRAGSDLDLLQLRLHGSHRGHGVGFGGLANPETHRVLAVEVLAGMGHGTLVDHIGDVLQAQAPLVHGKDVEVLQRPEHAPGHGAVADSAVRELPQRAVQVDARQVPVEPTCVHPIPSELIQAQIHADLGSLSSEKFDLGHSRDPLDPSFDLHVQELVGGLQVPLGRNPQSQDGRIVGTEVDHVDPFHVFRKLAADPLDPLPDLSPEPLHVHVHVEKRLHPGAAAIGERLHPLDTGDRADDLFHRFGDGLQDMSRRGIGIRNLHHHKGEVQVGKQHQGNLEQGDHAHQEQQGEDGADGHRIAHGKAGQRRGVPDARLGRGRVRLPVTPHGLMSPPFGPGPRRAPAPGSTSGGWRRAVRPSR